MVGPIAITIGVLEGRPGYAQEGGISYQVLLDSLKRIILKFPHSPISLLCFDKSQIVPILEDIASSLSLPLHLIGQLSPTGYAAGYENGKLEDLSLETRKHVREPIIYHRDPVIFLIERSHVLLSLGSMDKSSELYRSWDSGVLGEHDFLDVAGGQLISFKTGPFIELVSSVEAESNNSVSSYVKVIAQTLAGGKKARMFKQQIWFHLKKSYLGDIDNLNKRLNNFATKNDARVSESAAQIIDTAAIKAFQLSEMSSSRISKMINIFAILDSYANFNQGRLLLANLIFAGLLPVSILFYELFGTLRPSPWLLAMQLLAITFALSIYVLIVAIDTQARYQDSRFMAEACRVQFYWALSGISATTERHVQSAFFSNVGWMHHALRGPSLLAAAIAAEVSLPALAAKEWIGCSHNSPPYSQVVWYKVAGETSKFNDVKLRRLQYLFFGASVLISILATAGSFKNEVLESNLFKLYLLLMAVLPSLAASMAIYRERRAFDAHRLLYNRMYALAEQSRQRIEESEAPQIEDIIRAFGHQVLQENSQWLKEHRGRPIEVVTAG
jgi:hypothetical protein